MTKRRDGFIALAAAAIVLILAGSVMTALLSAERNGRRALEDLQLAQLQQLARVLDGAFAPSLTSTAGLTNPSSGLPWNLKAGDTVDTVGLELLQHGQPTARTGYVLIDKNGTVTSGTLLKSKDIIDF